MTQATAHRPLAEDVPDDALLKVDGATLSFGQVRALKGVTMHARRGEVTAIVGDNGAGKSTLIRCVSGVHAPDSGSIDFDGQAVHFRSPHDARDAGIETVHQNLALVEDLTVWQNLFLNREIVRRFGPFAVLNRRAMRAKAEEMVSGLAVNVPAVGSRVRRLSGGQRQAVSICRAAGFTSKLIIMDEPTAALGVQETARVEELITRLRSRGSRDHPDQPQLLPGAQALRRGVGDARRPLRGGQAHRRHRRRRDRRADHRRPARRLHRRTARSDRMTPTAEVPNPIGVHALVWVGDTSPASVESAISQTVAAGYDILEFSLHDAVSIDRDKTRELLTANGIPPHAHAGWRATPMSPATTRPWSRAARPCWRSLSR